MRDLEQELADKFGLDCRSLGANALADALRGHVCPEKADLQELAEQLAVPETWFFRDTIPFNYLARHARTAWLPRTADAPPIRILSAPCATGEEPYSIVMTLLEAGMPPEAIAVDAVDISANLLALARHGVYGERAFRETAPEHIQRFFTSADAGRRAIACQVKKCVSFYHANIMDLDGCVGLATEYQAIFCRNVLIYQHAPARRRMAKILARRLATDGLLFVGHAEMLALFDDVLRPAPHRGAFAYCKTTVCKNGVSQDLNTDGARTNTDGARGRTSQPICSTVQCSDSAADAPDDMESDLLEARRLADAGQTAAAEMLCQKILHARPLWAEAHVLAGLIRAATGRADEAEACLRRAVYLDAHCREALLHLALLKERRGAAADAAVLRRRIRLTSIDAADASEASPP